MRQLRESGTEVSNLLAISFCLYYYFSMLSNRDLQLIESGSDEEGRSNLLNSGTLQDLCLFNYNYNISWSTCRQATLDARREHATQQPQEHRYTEHFPAIHEAIFISLREATLAAQRERVTQRRHQQSAEQR